MPSAAEPQARIRAGSRAFWRANAALFLAAFSVFALLYSVQPLLPLFAATFGVEAAEASLSLSFSTGLLAGFLLLASWLADRWGRKQLMVASLLATATLGLLVVAIDDWYWLLAMRALLGIAISGVPAVAMVYLAEEMEAEALGVAMGLYIGGSGLGGMAGRLLVGPLADHTSWRVALGVLGLLALANAALFWWLLPAARHAPRGRVDRRGFLLAVRSQFRDAALPWLFAEAFLIMGTFVMLYNYIGFRLAAPPYGLSHTAISLIFLVYLLGSGSSAWIGALAGRLGRRKVLWLMIAVMTAGLALTALPSIVAMIGGLAVLTIGFFGAHSVASSWVGRRARSGRAQATALYLFFYYLGSSVLGTLGGYAWSRFAWGGVLLLAGAAALLALAIAVRLFHVQPLPGAGTAPPAPP